MLRIALFIEWRIGGDVPIAAIGDSAIEGTTIESFPDTLHYCFVVEDAVTFLSFFRLKDTVPAMEWTRGDRG